MTVRTGSSRRSTFAGFPPSGLRFLSGLAKNNEKAWFEARKQTYLDDVLAPLKAFVADLSARNEKAGIPIVGDDKRSVFRIYRDVRFSPDKRPYKTHASAYLSPDGGRHTPGGLYLHVDPKAPFIGIAFYNIPKPMLAAWRERMADDPKSFLAVVKKLEKSGVPLEHPDEAEDALTRIPREYAEFKDEPIGPYFRLKHFVVHEPLEPADLARPDLVDRAVALIKAAKPLLVYGWGVANALPPGALAPEPGPARRVRTNGRLHEPTDDELFG